MIQFIALCGYPKAGKSKVQALIAEMYGYHPVDDSAALREGAMKLYGLSEWHVQTQEGKASTIRVGDKAICVRALMGNLGKYLEADDPYHFPRLAAEQCLARDPCGKFVFGSGRMDQGAFLKRTHGALVVEVRREGTGPVGDFDIYDRNAVDITIPNTPDISQPRRSEAALRRILHDRLDPILGKMPAA